MTRSSRSRTGAFDLPCLLPKRPRVAALPTKTRLPSDPPKNPRFFGTGKSCRCCFAFCLLRQILPRTKLEREVRLDGRGVGGLSRLGGANPSRDAQEGDKETDAGSFPRSRPDIPPRGPAAVAAPTGRTARGCAAPQRAEQGRAGGSSAAVVAAARPPAFVAK